MGRMSWCFTVYDMPSTLASRFWSRKFDSASIPLRRSAVRSCRGFDIPNVLARRLIHHGFHPHVSYGLSLAKATLLMFDCREIASGATGSPGNHNSPDLRIGKMLRDPGAKKRRTSNRGRSEFASRQFYQKIRRMRSAIEGPCPDD